MNTGVEEREQGEDGEGGGGTEAAKATEVAEEPAMEGSETAMDAEYSIEMLLEYLERATTRVQIKAQSAAAGMAAALGLAV